MSNETETDQKTTVQILDACERWASPEELGTSAERLSDLVAADLLVEHDGRYLRDRRAMVAARMRAGSIATKEGEPASSFDRENITPGDLDFLVEHGLLNRSPTGTISVDLKAEQLLYSSGFRLFVTMALPPAEAPAALEPLAKELLDLVAAGCDWQKTDELQAAVNAARGTAEHVALGPIETALADLFHASLVEMKDEGGGRRWREDSDRAVARRAILLAKIALTLGEGATLENLMGELGQLHDVIDADVGALVDAGLLVLVDDAVKLRVDAGGTPDIWRFAAAEASHARDRDAAAIVDPAQVRTLIGEVADWREKHATERRRANDLASWIGRKGFSEADALDEIRGVTVVAKPKREVFTFTSARTINDAEKGLILGEIIAIDQKIAAVRGELEVLTSDHKTRIKELVKEIEGLKSAAACSQRVIECEAYKVTNWKEGKVRTYRVSDDVLLAEEEIPKGQQRTIETDAKGEKPTVSISIDGGKTEDVRAPAEQLAVTKEGAESVVEAASKLPFPTGEAELAEAVFSVFQPRSADEVSGLDLYGVDVALDQRFDVPVGCGRRVALALDRLVERGSLEVIDERDAGLVWARTATAEPGPLSLPADPKAARAPAPEKPKRSRKAKAPEASAT